MRNCSGIDLDFPAFNKVSTVPEMNGIAASRDVRYTVISFFIGSCKIRVIEYQYHCIHVGMYVAIDPDNTGRIKCDRAELSLWISTEVELSGL